RRLLRRPGRQPLRVLLRNGARRRGRQACSRCVQRAKRTRRHRPAVYLRTGEEPMREANFGEYHIRKWFTCLEDTLATETGALADGDPVRKIVIAAAIHNPYAGRYSEDLSQIVHGSAKLGLQFGHRVQAAAAGRPVESYGKACLVGTGGEYEHGNAFLTQVFADPVRDAVG